MSVEQLGLFLHLAGYCIGIGAVTVIDLHGFLGRKSSYWTEATIRTHKVTKPLIWLGITLASIGGMLLYHGQWGEAVPRFQALIALVLIANGSVLSFWLSPRLIQREVEGKSRVLLPASWQRYIIASFVTSFVGWWGSLTLTVMYLL